MPALTVRSTVQWPVRADNVYSGQVSLVDGVASVDLDSPIGMNKNWYTMTQGTFAVLNKDLRVFVNNNETWDRVRGKVISQNSSTILLIESENTASTATIDWMVIGTRSDPNIISSDLTDSNGDFITEKVEPRNPKAAKYEK